MATDFFSLPPAQQIQISTDLSLKYYGVTKPLTEAGQNAKLNNAIEKNKQSLNELKSNLNSIVSASAQARGLPESEIRNLLYNLNVNDPRLKSIPGFNEAFGAITKEANQLLAPSYSINSFTIAQITTLAEGTTLALQEIAKNPTSLPAAGQNVTFTPTPVPAVTVTPAVSTPKTTTNPSNSGITTSDIVKAAVLVEGSIALYNALNTPTVTRIESPAPTTIPDTVQDDIEIPVDKVDIATAPNTNVGNENIENSSPATIDVEDALEKARLEAQAEYENTPPRTEQDIIDAYGGMKGLQGSVDNARARQITQDAENAKTQGDWRVRLSLAPSASYLYKAANPGILKYLQKTDGVIFPYVPQIQVTYAAHYDAAELTHSNYKIFQYKNSSIDQISITCDFTAQDNEEANYLLAVIHFFRSVTKMFYGQDDIPKAGTPPPLCYLSGLGGFQFDRHPLVISSFNYSLPNDVDYIRAGSPTLQPGVDSSAYNGSTGADATVGSVRLGRLNPGATENAPQFTKATNTQPTYVPTKISISLVAYPIVTRSDISNKFSLADYATGALLQGSKNPSGGGIW